MIDDHNTELAEHIREHSRQHRWFGGDSSDPAPGTFSGYVEYATGPDGHDYVRGTEDEPEMFDFAYPPATAEQLASTEAALGFSLPSLLRFLYSILANGGFGPGSGLTGAIGGHPWEGGERPNMTIEQTLKSTDARLPDHIAAQLEAQPGTYFECAELPDRFLTLCDWGDGMASCLDGWAGRVYVVGAVVGPSPRATCCPATHGPGLPACSSRRARWKIGSNVGFVATSNKALPALRSSPPPHKGIPPQHAPGGEISRASPHRNPSDADAARVPGRMRRSRAGLVASRQDGSCLPLATRARILVGNS